MIGRTKLTHYEQTILWAIAALILAIIIAL